MVTPMFIGDANQKATGISAASFKGALRFWWRALVWASVRSTATTSSEALKKLHEQESQLFGSAAGDKTTCQSAVAVQILHAPLKTIINWPPKSQSDSSAYLAYGLTGDNGAAHREAITEDQLFTVELTFKPSVTAQQMNSVRDALTLLGMAGGLGGRARRALGSVAMILLDQQEVTFDNDSAWLSEITKLLDRYKTNELNELPPFTAFSKFSSIQLIVSGRDAREAHLRIGSEYKEFRKNIPTKSRVPLGLPLTSIDTNKRRSSPLLLHIHPVGKGFTGVAVFLPAVFHPDIKAGNTSDYFTPVSGFGKEARK